MEFFIYCTYYEMFFTGSGFTSNFLNVCFFTNIQCAIACIYDYLDHKDDLDLCIDDFVFYQKGDIC